jgi:hypothetical protein
LRAYDDTALCISLIGKFNDTGHLDPTVAHLVAVKLPLKCGRVKYPTPKKRSSYGHLEYAAGKDSRINDLLKQGVGCLFPIYNPSQVDLRSTQLGRLTPRNH